MVNLKSTPKKIGKLFAEHLVDTTAILTVATPALAAWETFGTGLPDNVSQDIRIIGTQLFYGGAGIAYSKGRDGYYAVRNKIRDLRELPEKKPLFGLHDTAYAFMFGVPFNTGVSIFKGVSFDDSLEVGVGNSAICAVLGYSFGKAIDAGRDFTGLQESNRLPLGVKKMSRFKKLALATGLVAASLGATKGVYEATPENFPGITKMIRGQESTPESSLEKSLE